MGCVCVSCSSGHLVGPHIVGGVGGCRRGQQLPVLPKKDLGDGGWMDLLSAPACGGRRELAGRLRC